MDELDHYERDTLAYVLRTHDEPEERREIDRAKALISYALGAGMILAAAYFLRSFGLERWFWIGLAALGGGIVSHGAVHGPLRRQFEILQEFIDYERIRARLDGR